MVRVRFAPSPTGYLHVGGARTALFNYLYAKKNDGIFVLRVEDTDQERSTRESENSLIETMKWLGLNWDEGPDCCGDFGPYRQSERMDIYKKVAHELVEKGKAYEAYIYPEELEKIREELLAKKESPHYNFDMISKFDTPERRAEYKEKGLDPVIYFRMPQKDYTVNDLIKGEITFKEGTIGDFVILRSNGMPIYNFAVAVDDAQMKITHVIRGDDHLSNTLRQLAIYEAMDYELPNFAHVSMILGPDGSRLSKRHGATAVENYREMGYLPESIVNYLALLSWSHPEGKEIMSMDEMISNFSLERVNSSAAIYDETKLRWMNGAYIRELDEDKLAEYSIPWIVKAGYMDESTAKANYKWIREAMKSIQNKLHSFDEIPEKIKVFFKDPILKTETVENVKNEGVEAGYVELLKEIQDMDSWTIEDIMPMFKRVTKNSKVKSKGFYHTLREVLTGSDSGPELMYVVHLIGRNKMLDRVERLVNAL